MLKYETSYFYVRFQLHILSTTRISRKIEKSKSFMKYQAIRFAMVTLMHNINSSISNYTVIFFTQVKLYN